MKYIRWLLLTSVLVISMACTQRTRTPVVVPEWSRASMIGTTSRAKPVGVVTEAESQDVVLAWPTRTESGLDYIHLYALDATGSVFFDGNLEPPLAGLDQVKFTGNVHEQLYLVWTAGAYDARVLWTSVLPTRDAMAGTIHLQPVQLSPVNSAVVWHAVYIWDSGDLLALWLNQDGNLFASLGEGSIPSNILENVSAIASVKAADGSIKLVWATQVEENSTEIKTTSLDVAQMRIKEPDLITQLRFSQTTRNATVGDLIISPNKGQYTISWTQPYEYGGRFSQQLVALTASAVGDRLIPESAVHYYPFSREFPPDLSFNSVLNMHVVYVEDSSISATFVRSAASSTSIKDLGVVLATSVSYATRTREEYQPTLVYYNGGHFIGHQPLTWTNFPSQYPVVTGDSTDALYAVWIDNTGVGFHYPVYLAGTSSAIRAKFQYLRLGDLAVIGWDWVNRVVSGIVLLPFIIEWYLLPVGLLVILMVLGDRYGRGRMYGLLMSVYLYWASKYIITPQLLAILPDYRFLPRFFEPLLPSGIPLCVLSVSLLIAAVCQRSIKREDISLFSGFLYITVPDALLSLVIYAIGGFG